MGVKYNLKGNENIKIGNIILAKCRHNCHTKKDLGEVQYTNEEATHKICKGCDQIVVVQWFGIVNKKTGMRMAFCNTCFRNKTNERYVRKTPKQLIVDGMKQCRRCTIFKDISKFPIRTGPDCSKCHSEKILEYQLEYKKRLLEKGITVRRCYTCKKEKDIHSEYYDSSGTCKQCYKKKSKEGSIK